LKEEQDKRAAKMDKLKMIRALNNAEKDKNLTFTPQINRKLARPTNEHFYGPGGQTTRIAVLEEIDESFIKQIRTKSNSISTEQSNNFFERMETQRLLK
jgi:hypothetical protein